MTCTGQLYVLCFIYCNIMQGQFRIFDLLISGFHRAFLKSVTVIGRLMHLIV